MFALASKCPHCGAVNREPLVDEVKKPAVEGPKPELKLSAEEARALLSTAQPKAPTEPGFAEIAAELVLPKGGAVELVLSIAAILVTGPTVVTLGGAMRAARKRGAPLDFRGARVFGVPSSAALLAVSLWQVQAPGWAWGVLGASISAWVVRELIRAKSAPEL